MNPRPRRLWGGGSHGQRRGRGRSCCFNAIVVPSPADPAKPVAAMALVKSGWLWRQSKCHPWAFWDGSPPENTWGGLLGRDGVWGTPGAPSWAGNPRQQGDCGSALVDLRQRRERGCLP